MDRLEICGKKYRVECNFNAIMAYMEAKGETDLSFLQRELSMRDWLLLMTAAVNEGERLDGKDHDHTPEEFGAMNMAVMAIVLQKFIEIFGRQNAGTEDSGEGSKKK